MTVEDVHTQNRRLWVRLREKGGKRHAMSCHHNLEEYLTAYLDRRRPAGGVPRGRCFAPSDAAPASSPAPCCRKQTPYAMIGRRAAAAGIGTKLGNHSFRATGITASLKNGGRLEKATAIAKKPKEFRAVFPFQKR